MAENNSIMRTGLCAFGMSGRLFHAPFLSCLDGFEFSAVVERHARRAQEVYPGVTTYNSVEAMLADDSLDLIVVNTPNVSHYTYAKKALEAGRHVVVEKPFTATSAQAEELIRLAADRNRFLCVFQNRRWDSDFLTVKEIIGKKLLGPLIEAEIRYERYRIKLNDQKKHKEKPEEGVGLIYDLGPHLIDEAVVLFGKPGAVSAIVQRHRPGSLVDDYFDIRLLYPDFTCILKSSLLVRENLPGYILHGTLGSFLKSRADVQEAALLEGVSPCTPGWGEEPESEWGLLHTERDGREIRERYPSLPGDYRQFFLSVRAALQQGEPSPVALADSLLNIQIIEAALAAGRENRAIPL
jgi:predicted dehydrogenase